jgi:hypothetical protein
MQNKNSQNVFLELTKADDLDGIGNLFAADGWTVYDGLIEAWFRQGVQMGATGKPLACCWNEHQRRGHKAHQVVMTAVAGLRMVSL